MQKKAEAYWPLILLLAIVKFVLPIFLQHPLFELQRDEYLYFQQGQHLAFGYLENPPLLSYLGWISSWFGGSAAWIKFWPCLFGATTVVVTCLITAELGGRMFAQFIAGIGIIGGAYMRTHYLFQPNFLDIFFWTLSVYFLVRFINSKDQKYIYGIGISLALGFWSKYSVLFMALALLIGLLLSPYRKIVTYKKTRVAAGLALLIILPNIIWQFLHNWPLFHHMKELRDTQLRYINKSDFIKEQLLMLSSVAVIWITGLIWTLSKKEWRILGIIYLAVFTLLLFGSGKGYYTLGAYPMLLAAGAVAWERISQKKNWIRTIIALLIIGINFISLPLLLPTRTPEKLDAFYKKIGFKHRWEDLQNHPLPQDFADMLGWKELTLKSEAFYDALPDSAKINTIIYCRNYGQAGSLKFYGKGDEFRNKIFSDNGSFLLWVPERLWMKNLLFIGSRIPDSSDKVFQHFEKMTLVDSVTDQYSRQYGNKIIFYENIDTTGLQLAIDGIEKMKKEFKQ